MRRNRNEVIHLSDKQKKQLISEIEAFYLDIRGEEIGIIERQQLSCFVIIWRRLFTIRRCMTP